MKNAGAFCAFLIALALARPGAAARAGVTIDLVTIGNPGNSSDTTGYGGVSYVYAIGKYDVTSQQYAAFLNAVATTDPYELYTAGMGVTGNYSGQYTGAGIARTGSSGSYTYSIIGASGSNPATHVTWFSSVRFCNWLHNGQPGGIGEVAASTEQGAYTLNGMMNGGLTLTKNANAKYWIPSENEWYKAAYYDISLNSGTGGYWLYPTRSNSYPGNVIGNLPNQANYGNGVLSVTQVSTYSSTQDYLSDVGAFTNSPSVYGTFDQGGNVWEWDDAVINTSRGWRGGSGGDSAIFMQSTFRYTGVPPNAENNVIGFRVAAPASAPVPALPSWAFVVLPVALLAVAARCLRGKRVSGFL